jgi:UDP-N-acetylglucosamine 2-epimerase (non-hydrolysing)
MKLAVVVGTRPEVIKMSPVIREIQARGIPFVLIHSNQHYSKEMDQVFFDELELPAPHHNLEISAATHSNQIGEILIRVTPVLEREKPDLLLIQGDTNTVVASALAAERLGIPVAHVEAGLRSYDRRMPEESNRVMTDHLSDLLFAVTDVQRNILAHEGIDRKKIHVVGNTIADAVRQNLDLAAKSQVLTQLGVKAKDYFLLTVHRASNVDDEAALRETLELLEAIAARYSQKIVWPVHPRTAKKLKEHSLQTPANVILTQPLGYLDFLRLEREAALILTDSGGVQEEACILGVPCITLRENTERPETIKLGANVLAGRDPALALRAMESFLRPDLPAWRNPFGDGDSAIRILDAVQEKLVPGSRRRVEPKAEKICVIGMGYMGLPTASLLAQAGYPVTGVDIDAAKVELINQGKSPFDEPGLPDLVSGAVKSGRLRVQASLPVSDIYIIALPTPARDEKCDLSYVMAATEKLREVVKDGDLVILESTVRPGTCRDVLWPMLSEKAHGVMIAHCPERAIPGNTLYELVYNDRIIGGLTAAATERTRDLYASFCKGTIHLTDAVTAEAVKLMENTFRDVNIAFANELSVIAEDAGFNVWEAIRLANRHPRVDILQPGPGVGGHCIAVDPWFLAEAAPEKSQLIRLARKINDSRPGQVVEKAERLARTSGAKRIGILGVAYKREVDDARETPAKPIHELLEERGFEVRAHDPFVKKWDRPLVSSLGEIVDWAEILVLVTDHEEYVTAAREGKFARPVLDTRNSF